MDEGRGAPAAWHPDPDRPGLLRYWDGSQWTEHRAPGEAASSTVHLLPPPPTVDSWRQTAVGGGLISLELTRTPGDRHLFELKGVGTLRLEAGFSRRAVAAGTGGQHWEIARRPERRRFARRGDLIVVITATEPSGTAAGEFQGRARIRGGMLRWGTHDLKLCSSSSWRPRYALLGDERQLATIEGKGWGKRPVKLTIVTGVTVEPGLLLLAAFAVGALTEDAQRNANAVRLAGSGFRL